jgi:adenylosuccinate lyase
MSELNYDTYLSPFTWRYGSSEMRTIFSEAEKYRHWRRIWVALAEVQEQAGLISKAELKDLQKQEKNFDVKAILDIETQTKHDVVAGIKEFADKAKVGGGKIHLGATSMDIVDNADSLRMRDALALIEKKVSELLHIFADMIDARADQVCMGFTHIQAAEPTTVGYRLALYAQDVLLDLEMLRYLQQLPLAKGMKGAVGTAASYEKILKGTTLTPAKMEAAVMAKLGISPSLITSQVVTRKYDYWILACLTSLCSSFAKFAADLRILQSPGFGEWSEGFGKKQVGSSAMPFKKNPINAEKICSLTRLVTQLPTVAIENATHSYLERTLDDSANKRVIMAEGFLATDEVLITAKKLLTGMVINDQRIQTNLNQYAPFSATESILIEIVKKGGDRQEFHEHLKDIAMKAWDQVQKGQPSPMTELLLTNAQLLKYLTVKEIHSLLSVDAHIGDAPQRAHKLAKVIRQKVKQ